MTKAQAAGRRDRHQDVQPAARLQCHRARRRQAWPLGDRRRSAELCRVLRQSSPRHARQGDDDQLFPAKPLGCYDDGGAIFTDADNLSDIIRLLLVHGKGLDKYDNARIGMNGRLDTIQAAILIEKLRDFDEEIELRDKLYKRSIAGLQKVAAVPAIVAGGTSVWAQYTINVPNCDAVAARLKAVGVPTAIRYPKPLHQQTAYPHYPAAPFGFKNSETLAQTALRLTMHPYLDEATQNRTIQEVVAALTHVDA